MKTLRMKRVIIPKVAWAILSFATPIECVQEIYSLPGIFAPLQSENVFQDGSERYIGFNAVLPNVSLQYLHENHKRLVWDGHKEASILISGN